jgi:hypothetical protein
VIRFELGGRTGQDNTLCESVVPSDVFTCGLEKTTRGLSGATKAAAGTASRRTNSGLADELVDSVSLKTYPFRNVCQHAAI